MSTHAPEAPEREAGTGRKRRTWLVVLVAVLVIPAIALGTWAIIAANQTDDIDYLAVATGLADTWLRGWDENDAEAVRSVFTDDAVYSDAPFTAGGTKTVEQTVADVGFRGAMITNVSRIGEVAPTDHGTFIFVAEFDAHGDRYSGEVEIELDGGLASRIEWLSLEVIDS